ncbi:hypothetical protein SUGI_0474520 [Cryptomeria japonica]|nr:hypothetical protein SUGI_0474520 [Cryptomeria japonica]
MENRSGEGGDGVLGGGGIARDFNVEDGEANEDGHGLFISILSFHRVLMVVHGPGVAMVNTPIWIISCVLPLVLMNGV